MLNLRGCPSARERPVKISRSCLAEQLIKGDTSEGGFACPLVLSFIPERSASAR